MKTNWAGNVSFGARDVVRPRSVEEVQTIVSRTERVRAIGTGHSFNTIADTDGSMISLALLPPSVEVDTVSRTARVSAGLRYGDLGPALREAGLALPNTGSLPHISIAGATATGTHGSGVRNPSLASSVRSVTLVTSTGDLLIVDRRTRPADFEGFVISLGRLGIVVELVLDLVPAFRIAQTVVDDVDDARVAEQLPQLLGAAYSVSVFTEWTGTGGTRVWVKQKVGTADEWAGAPLWGGRVADGPRHPIQGMPTEHATIQMSVPGPWDERLPHFRLEHTPSSGDELQSEYFVAARHANAVWDVLRGMHPTISPVLQVSEVRSVAPESLWLSPTRGEPAVTFHFTWTSDAKAVRDVVTALEANLVPFDARPHWGKLFGIGPSRLAGLYPRLSDFAGLVTGLDPSGKFANELVDGWLGLR
jgi:xylitol oxidase